MYITYSGLNIGCVLSDTCATSFIRWKVISIFLKFEATEIAVNHFFAVGGKPIPVSHMTLQAPLQQQGTAVMTAGTQSVSGVATVIKQQQQQPQPVVAKVLTGTQGQMISMESLLAHQKQHGTLPQGVHNSLMALYSMHTCHLNLFV